VFLLTFHNLKLLPQSKPTVTMTNSSHRSALAAGFVAGCSVAATVSWLLLRAQKQRSGEKLMDREKNDAAFHRSLPDDIRDEQLSRHTLYFGESGMAKLKAATVCVVGVGGVGSHAAHMLARSGLGHLRLVDFDQVTVSSLNRHACATLRDVGTAKVECLAQFLRKICPDAAHLQVETVAEMYTAATGARLLHLPEGRLWNMVVDCIDDVPTKAALLAYCLQNKIRVISCMGAGGKADPTRLHISDLRSAANDPLASKIRQSLKKYMKEASDDTSYLDDMDQLTILYSSEKTVVKLADFTAEQKEEGVHNFGAVDGMRIRVVPVLGTMPAIMGQALASICVTVLAGKQMQPVTGERIGRNARNKIYSILRTREQNLTARIRAEVDASPERTVSIRETKGVNGVGELVTVTENDGSFKTTWIGALQIDQSDDMEYLMEIWRNRCGVTGARLGTVLHLVRWDRSQTSTCDNLVLVGANVLPGFEADPEEYKNKLDASIRTRIETRLATCIVDR
jgi:tRNA A37 threonylcarbamoyladenosine dehydratase